MPTTTETLQRRSLELIKTAITLLDIAYIVKSLADSKQITSQILDEVNKKVIALEATATAKEISFMAKALETVTVISSDKIYSLGQPGELGFGVATCPADLLPTGWNGMSGHDDIASPNYGNYLDSNGSVLVYIPRHFYYFVGNELYFSDQPATNYVLDRSFINGGVEKRGIFVYKYGASNMGGIFGSVKDADPLSTSTAHNPIGLLNNTPINNYGGLYTAVKSAGTSYFLTSIFNYSMLSRLAFAHGKASTSTSNCAYIDVNPKMPKGCLVSALKDVNDSSVTYTPSGYSDCGLTGSGTPFAKTTHNGQDCGIADLNGNMWEVASGFIRYDANGFLVLKESADITAIPSDSITAGAGGAYDVNLYDLIDISDIVSSNAGWIYLGNGTNAVFSMNTDRITASYKRTSLGIANATGVSGSGTTEFGNDGLYRYLRNEMACRVGGAWSDSSDAGLFAMHLSANRASSSYNVGGRACVLV